MYSLSLSLTHTHKHKQTNTHTHTHTHTHAEALVPNGRNMGVRGPNGYKRESPVPPPRALAGVSDRDAAPHTYHISELPDPPVHFLKSTCCSDCMWYSVLGY